MLALLLTYITQFQWPFLLEKDKCSSVSHSVMYASLGPHGLQPTRLLCPWDSPGKNTGEDCHSLQRTFLTQGQNPGLLHCRQILYHLSYREAKYWSGQPFPSPADLPDPGIKLGLLNHRWILYQLSYQGSPQKTGAFLNQKCLDTYTFGVFYSYQKDTTRQDSTLPLQGTWVSSLVRELTSHILWQKKPFIQTFLIKGPHCFFK